jgi:hypothetical protein
VWSHRSAIANRHLVWNPQPEGRWNGCGTEPLMLGNLLRATDCVLGIESSNAWV